MVNDLSDVERMEGWLEEAVAVLKPCSCQLEAVALPSEFEAAIKETQASLVGIIFSFRIHSFLRELMSRRQSQITFLALPSRNHHLPPVFILILEVT